MPHFVEHDERGHQVHQIVEELVRESYEILSGGVVHDYEPPCTSHAEREKHDDPQYLVHGGVVPRPAPPSDRQTFQVHQQLLVAAASRPVRERQGDHRAGVRRLRENVSSPRHRSGIVVLDVVEMDENHDDGGKVQQQQWHVEEHVHRDFAGRSGIVDREEHVAQNFVRVQDRSDVGQERPLRRHVDVPSMHFVVRLEHLQMRFVSFPMRARAIINELH